MKKKIIITGNLGYVGIELVKKILKTRKYQIIGIDNKYFAKSIVKKIKKNKLFNQKISDIRNLNYSILKDVYGVIHLAAISNDPIGDQFYKATNSINKLATKKIILYAKKYNVKNFIFASSCSVYGFTKSSCNERSKVSPLTAYSKSKIYIEKILKKVSNSKFKTTALRFATACGYSDNPRLDLVLNNLIMSGIVNEKIELNSAGNAIRPLIDVSDMCKTIIWFLENREKNNKNFLNVNVGNTKNNIKVIDLAKIISKKLGNIKIVFNSKNDDRRSYKVNFSQLNKITKKKLITKNINKTINEVIEMIKKLKKNKMSNYIRLQELKRQISIKLINKNLVRK